MQLKKISLKNIRSYEDQEISFNPGSVLLSGDIGSGKTTVLLAIEYALFGLQPGQKGSALLKNGEREGSVSLEFSLETSSILIERTLKRTSKSISNDYSAITVDGEKFELSPTELKTKVINLLGYPQEFIKKNNLLYRYTVYTPQEKMKEIITEDPEARLNTIRHIFGIDKYKRIRENLSHLISNLKEGSKVLQGEIKSLDKEKERASLLSESVSRLKSEIQEKDLELKSFLNKRVEIESDLQGFQGKIEEKEKFEREIDKTNILIQTKEELLLSIKKEIDSIESELENTRAPFSEEQYSSLTSQINSKKLDLESLQKNLITIESKLDSLERSKGEDSLKRERILKFEFCPTCLQEVSEVHKHNIVNSTEGKITQIKKDSAILNEQKIQVNQKIQEITVNLKQLEEQKNSLDLLKSKTEYLASSKIKLSSLLKQRLELENDLCLLSKHISVLKSNILSFSKFNNLLKIKQQDLSQHLGKEKSAEISLAESKKELQLTELEISRTLDVVAEKEKSKEKLLYHLELIDWFSKQFLDLVNFTERNVLMRLRSEFSQLFNKWFHMLVDQDSFEVRLDETFSPIIIQGGAEMEYAFLSGGERTAVALAYRLALNQTINSVMSKIKTRDLVILDEPTDGFSESQLDKMRDILEELNISQLLVVSHEQKIESFVDTIIRIKKSQGHSYLDSPVPSEAYANGHHKP